MGESKGFLQRGFDLNGLQEPADSAERSSACLENDPVGFGKIPWLRHASGVPVRQIDHPMNEISPRGDEFVIVAANEFAPIPAGVPALGRARCKIVTNSIRVKAILKIRCPQRPTSAGAHFFPFQVVKLVSWNIVWQCLAAIPD